MTAMAKVSGSISDAALRMRAHRRRRKRGLRCITIEVRGAEVDALVREGLLKIENRGDPDAILVSLYAYLDKTLGRRP